MPAASFESVKPCWEIAVKLFGAAVSALLLMTAIASAEPTRGEFPWQIGGVVHVPVNPHP
jgi:hypothetical protein